MKWATKQTVHVSPDQHKQTQLKLKLSKVQSQTTLRHVHVVSDFLNSQQYTWSKTKQRVKIIFLFKLNETLTETFNLPREVYTEDGKITQSDFNGRFESWKAVRSGE
jgi:hypothetical protein